MFDNFKAALRIAKLWRQIKKGKAMFKNPVTTGFGICALLAAIATAGMAIFDGNPETTVNIQMLIAAVGEAAVGLGLIKARDANVTSEQSGAK